MTKILIVLSTLLLSACSVFGVRSVEEPSYDIVAELGDGFEVRRYAARMAAEVAVDNADGDASSAAFRKLFGYISGANSGGREIAMTAPVEQQAQGHEIAMTAPVETLARDGAFVMRFFLPSSFTIETSPTPDDLDVTIVAVEPETYAVERFTGRWSNERLEQRQAALLERLVETAWTPTGEPVAWLYDPPWTLPPFRRNEVVVPVERD